MILVPSIFKSYDVRAIYGQEVDDEGWADVVKGAYAYLQTVVGKDVLTINIGYDMRVESEKLYRVTIKVLQDLGAQINLVGISSTPLSYFAMLRLKADASMQHTASHNPAGYSGMKCVWRNGDQVMKVPGTAIKDTVINKRFPKSKSGSTLNEIKSMVDVEAQTALESFPQITKQYKVVADTANGMGVTYLKALQRLLPLDIVYLNEELDGTFPNHLSDTLQRDLWKKLQERVVSEHADFGIATDGDADRIAFVDESGRFLPNTLITCAVMDIISEKVPSQTYLVDIRSLLNAQNFAKKIGASIHVTKVGHANITADMHTTHSPFGGESSGHYFFKETGGAESAMRVIISIIAKLQESGTTLGTMLRQYESAHEAAETNFIIPTSTTSQAIFDKLKEVVKDAQIDLLDGITFNFPTWRTNIRTSNTEPLLRLNVEALSLDEMNKMRDVMIQHILDCGCTLKSSH